ncbi:MAG: hypothetical protein COA78_04515 [Blastopirellula sp.]|nr:MAG: hypothetical protein COA78_04515 [Blastopirellula sp.]
MRLIVSFDPFLNVKKLAFCQCGIANGLYSTAFILKRNGSTDVIIYMISDPNTLHTGEASGTRKTLIDQ